jgi:hypothetical protein
MISCSALDRLPVTVEFTFLTFASFAGIILNYGTSMTDIFKESTKYGILHIPTSLILRTILKDTRVPQEISDRVKQYIKIN